MAKTVQLDTDVHLLLVNARTRLLNKKIYINIAEIVGSIIKDHIEEFIDKAENIKDQSIRTVPADDMRTK